MILRFTTEEFALIQAHPLPWWSRQARWDMGLMAPGVPAQELGAAEEPTGWLLMSGATVWDQFILEVMRAGWEFASQHEDGEVLIEYQQSQDWKAWGELESLLTAGSVTRQEAVEMAKQYMVNLGETLGISPPQDNEDDLA